MTPDQKISNLLIEFEKNVFEILFDELNIACNNFVKKNNVSLNISFSSLNVDAFINDRELESYAGNSKVILGCYHKGDKWYYSDKEIDEHTTEELKLLGNFQEVGDCIAWITDNLADLNFNHDLFISKGILFYNV